ncbi:DNA-binding MarR family transcriptional regulator [Leucobacter exalbidus]|uniref:DNA-binding MarR family transcriptional regulator n=1 Tax=Leucobacter exalbidus TaxID=662960 RepID=A0A940T3J3_9MICO|nr:MarR family transcriptional regulator [Leucobacter exalbidus]MBP1325814.1 DNA-binding MarR family transcriptional regulator [Leucobacter exalbidus]
MTSQLTHPERIAVARLHALLELLPTALDKRLGVAGVTSFEYTLLDALSQSDAHRMRLSEVARKTNATLPRISRVATSLERRGLIERAPCPADGRATNAVLTAAGAAAHETARDLYALAVRELVLEGLAQLPGDGVAQLTDLTYAILTSLDPEHPRIMPEVPAPCAADPASAPAGPGSPATEPPTEVVGCAADPVAEQIAEQAACAADLAPEPVPCSADPAPSQCAADPAA